jgi:hypothetical protein
MKMTSGILDCFFHNRIRDEACTKISVTPERARGFTRTTCLLGLEDWKVSEPWGSSQEDEGYKENK